MQDKSVNSEADKMHINDQENIITSKSIHQHIGDHEHGHAHSHDHEHNHDHDHGGETDGWESHWDLLLGFAILFTMLLLKYAFDFVPAKSIDFLVHFVAFILAGWRVADLAFRSAKRGDFFNEFVLMTTATLGA